MTQVEFIKKLKDSQKRIEELEHELEQRKQVEKKFPESEKNFKQLFDHSPDALLLGDLKGTILDVNKISEKITGYKKEDFIGRSFFETKLLQPNQMLKASKLFSNIILRKHVSPEEFTIKIKDGSTIDLEIKADIVKIENKKRILISSRDISKRKQAEEELRQSKEFVEAVLNNINDELCVIDPTDFTIKSANKAFLNIYQLKKKDVIGKCCYEVTHNRTTPCSTPNDICPLKETLKTGKHSSAEHIHFNSIGKVSYIDVSTSPIKNENGEIYQIIHRAQDITQRKLAERDLMESEKHFRGLYENTGSLHN